MHDRDRSSVRDFTRCSSARRMASNLPSWAPSRSQSLKSMVATNTLLSWSLGLSLKTFYRGRRVIALEGIARER